MPLSPPFRAGIPLAMVRSPKPESGKPEPPSPGGGDQFDFTAMLGIADALPVALAYVDRDLVYRFVNAGLAEFFDLPRSAILGRSMEQVLSAAAMTVRRPMLKTALGGERVWFAANYEHPSRGPLTIQSDYLPQRGADGSVNGLVILIHDVTEQRVAGQALRESEARFRRIADSAPVPMWVTRLDRSRDFVNQAYID